MKKDSFLSIIALICGFGSGCMFGLNYPKQTEAKCNTTFTFDSTWYHHIEDSLYQEFKKGNIQNGKVYKIKGHEFSWTSWD